MTNLSSILKKQIYYFAKKGLYSQSYGFSSSRVWMWELDHKESWVLKNWCFQTVMLEKTTESPLDCKEIKPVNFKGYQPWIFIWRTDVEAEVPILWQPVAKSQFIWKDPDAGKDWRQEEDDRGQDDWVISLTQRTWIWASSRRWWRTGKPGVLHSMGPQTVRHDWVTGYQQGLKQSTNCELPDVQGGFRKGGRTRDQTTSIHWITEKKGEFQKNIYFSFIDYMRAFDVLITTNCGKFWDYQTTLSVFWETCMQVKEQQ